jgi:uncharacterized repeat protein (TIGR01451 family)
MALPTGLLAQPTISKTFGAASIAMGATTTLSFTVTNAGGATLTGVSFTDNFPAGLIVGTPAGITGFCTNGSSAVVNANAGAGVTSLLSGTLVANSLCTFTINVTATTGGVKDNVTTPVASSAGAGGTASASLNVAFATPVPVMSWPGLAGFTLLLAGVGCFFARRTPQTL